MPTELPVVNGAITFDVVLDDDPTFEVTSLNTPGYWFPRPRDYRATTVAPGDTPFGLSLPLQPAGLITGTVTDESGAPLPNASLSLGLRAPLPAGRLADGPNQNINSDAHGRFVISPVPFGGRYRVYASSRDLGKFAFGYTAPFTLRPDAPRPDHPVVVRRGTDVTVTVKGPDGQPIASASVNVIREGPDGGRFSWVPTESTDRDGRVVLTGILLSDPDITWRVAVTSERGFLGTRVPLDGPAVDVTLQSGATVTGTLIDDATGRPLPDIHLRAVIPWKDQDQEIYAKDILATTDADGRFVFAGLKPGIAHTLKANPPSEFYFMSTLVRTSHGGITHRPELAPQITPEANPPNPPLEIRVSLDLNIH